MAAIVVCDKIQSHDYITLGHNTAALHYSASVEASAIEYLPKMDPKLLHSKINETTSHHCILIVHTYMNVSTYNMEQ